MTRPTRNKTRRQRQGKGERTESVGTWRKGKLKDPAMPQGHRSGSTSDESVPYAELGARRKEALAAEPGRGHREPAARGANEVLRRRERGIRAADRAGFSNDASFDDELAQRGVACSTVDDLATALRAQIGPNELIPPSPSVARRGRSPRRCGSAITVAARKDALWCPSSMNRSSSRA